MSGNFAFEQGSAIEVILTDNTPGTTADNPRKTVNVLKVGASNVNAFVGVGGPYWRDSNGDGVIDDTDTPDADGALGVALSDLDFGLALLKPTDIADKASYMALSASGGVEFVGIDGLTIRADVLGIEINSASDPSVLPPGTAVPVIDFAASAAANPADFGNATGLVVETGSDPDGNGPLAAPSVVLGYTDAFLRAFGDVTIIISEFVYVSGKFSFEKGSEENGHPGGQHPQHPDRQPHQEGQHPHGRRQGC